MIDEVVDKLGQLLEGRLPEEIDLNRMEDESGRGLAEMMNRLIGFMREVHEFIDPLSHGRLKDLEMKSDNFLASPFKELHSRLRHLTWQASQVSNGDYTQRVDFMGEFSESFNAMIISLDEKEKALKRKITELETALSRIRNLEGILPICASCKRIRKEGADPARSESWVQIEGYISEKTDAQFSHGICPDCMKKLYPDM